MKTHIEPAKTIARARMMVDSVLELGEVASFQPAGRADVSNAAVVEVEVEVGMGV